MLIKEAKKIQMHGSGVTKDSRGRGHEFER